MIAGHDKVARFGAGGHRVKFDEPFAVRIRRYRFCLPGEFNRDLLAAFRRAPDRHGFLALQNHVAGERAGEFHLGQQRAGGEQQDRNCQRRQNAEF